MKPPSSFLQEAEEIGVAFDEGDLDRLGRYIELLLEENQRINLTSIREPEEAWRRHVLDALTLLPILAEAPAGAAAVDVGSGGGAPGLPLAIVSPEMRVALIEATGKKARFLESVIDDLSLANARVVNERAETAGRNQSHRETYDFALARAIGPLNVALELTLPLVRPGGQALLTKGAKAEEEVAEARGALDRLRGEVAGVVPSPTGRIVVVDKTGPTPRKYPRRSGEPKRAPLS